MPVKVRRGKLKMHRITEAAVSAFAAGDVLGLHRALTLRPWQPSPLPLSVTALGVDPAEPPTGGPGEWRLADWDLATELQRELIAAQDASP